MSGKHISEDGEQIFAANLDNGNIRIGYAGGPMKDFPPAMASELAAALKNAVNFDAAEDIIIDCEF